MVEQQRRYAPLAGYQELCRELTAAGPGTFGELDTHGVPAAKGRPPILVGLNLGIIHPHAVAGPGDQLMVSGRAIRAECRQRRRDREGRSRAAARRAPHRGHHGHRALITAGTRGAPGRHRPAP